MSETIAPKSSIGSLIASRRKRRISEGEPPALEGPEPLRASLRRSGETVLEGHVVDPADPDRRFVVELLLNGLPTQIACANLYDTALGRAGIGDGCYGFCFHLAPAVIPSLATAAVRIANLDETVGDLIAFEDAKPFAASNAPAGHVAWAGGLRLSGWIRQGAAAFPAVIEAHVDGILAATARADTWVSIAHGGIETAEPGFSISLPRELADGRARQVEVRCAGRPLPGSPVTLIAFADGLEAFLAGHADVDSERPRGAFFDAAFPDAVPFDAFEAWEARFPVTAPSRGTGRPLALAVIGEDTEGKTLTGPILDADDAWVGAVLPAAGGPTHFEPSDLIRFLDEEGSTCEAVVFLPAGAEVRPGALDRLAAALDRDPSADIAYPDVLVTSADGARRPLARTVFDYERALEQGAGAACFAMRRSAVLAAARRGIGELYRLFLAPLDEGGLHRVAHLHVPGFGFALPHSDAGVASIALAAAVRDHLAQRQVPAETTARAAAFLPAVRICRKTTNRSVTLIVDGGGDGKRIGPLLDALEATRLQTPIDIVATATDSNDALLRRLTLAGIAFVQGSSARSRTERLGKAALSARGDLICFLDARLRMASSDWLDELISRAAEADVGAVGPIMQHASGIISEAGWVLRAAGRPVPAFADRRAGDSGYGDALCVARQTSAIGDACLLTRRSDFLALGGFDPQFFPETYGAIDYCLKLQALGRRVVVTPDAILAYAQETGEEMPPTSSALRIREREERTMRARWGGVLANDPFYSPFLDRGMTPFCGLSWPPGDASPRRAGVSPARHVPLGW